MFEPSASIDDKVDVWAAACCVLEMLTGKSPFSGFPMAHIMHKVCIGNEAPPELKLPDVPGNINAVLQKCFHPDPAGRPTAAAVQAELETLSANQAVNIGFALLQVPLFCV